MPLEKKTVEKKTYSAVVLGRDEVHLEIEIANGTIADAKLRAIGCPDLLQACTELRPLLKGALEAVPLPEGDSHQAMLLRELLLKARGEWQHPYPEQELCHCRAVPTAKVDAAVVCGAHDVASINQRTSAGTSCGSCQPDILSLIHYRKSKSA